MHCIDSLGESETKVKQLFGKPKKVVNIENRSLQYEYNRKGFTRFVLDFSTVKPVTVSGIDAWVPKGTSAVACLGFLGENAAEWQPDSKYAGIGQHVFRKDSLWLCMTDPGNNSSTFVQLMRFRD